MKTKDWKYKGIKYIGKIGALWEEEEELLFLLEKTLNIVALLILISLKIMMLLVYLYKDKMEK